MATAASKQHQNKPQTVVYHHNAGDTTASHASHRNHTAAGLNARRNPSNKGIKRIRWVLLLCMQSVPVAHSRL
jgi:hypothetical protein